MTVSNSDRYRVANRHIDTPNVLIMEFSEVGSSVIHRAALNNEDIVSNGHTYVRSGISITIPNSSSRDHRIQVSIPNISGIPGQLVSKVNSDISVRIMNTSAENRDNLLQDTGNLLRLVDVVVSPATVAGTLVSRVDFNLPYPPNRATKNAIPGVWLS